eukprot:403333591
MHTFQKYFLYTSSTFAQHSTSQTQRFLDGLLPAMKHFSTENLGSGAGAAPKKIDLKSMTLKMMKPGGSQVNLPFTKGKKYDVIVIGGGTGGLSFAQEARKLGMTVALFDYVEPSSQGNTWGLGGTCVNVGCIPKKLFHISTQVKENIEMGSDYGWTTKEPGHLTNNWEALRTNIQNYIKGINFGYKNKLKEIGVDFIDARASFKDEHTVKFNYPQKQAATTNSADSQYELQADNFVIAAGVRPRHYENLPELKDYAITSDDLFSLKENPGKTLVIGGGYIAVECAGFLAGLGNEVILANRSSFLRVFDNDMANKVEEQLAEEGINFMKNTVIKSVKKLEDKLYEVELETNKNNLKKVKVNTILVAIGRDANPAGFQAENAQILLDQHSKKIVGRQEERERTSIDHIYAVGDVVQNVPELMPVAQKSGRLLAHRVFQRKQNQLSEDQILKTYSTDYNLIPTTIFSPTEYSFVGLSEEEAQKQYGADNIEVYHRESTPLQYSIYKNNTKIAYMKLIVDKTQDERVLGLHYFGPGADEVIGGFAVAMKLGMTKRDLDSTIGIHPSTSEDLYNLDVTKRSGGEYRKTEC